MPRPNIKERTEAEVLATRTRDFFRSVSNVTPVIPNSYAGKYALMLAVAVNSEFTEANMDALETAIDALTEVHKSFVLIGPARIPTNRVPAGHDLRLGVEGRFSIEVTPV
jgi:hypothetical protein